MFKVTIFTFLGRTFKMLPKRFDQVCVICSSKDIMQSLFHAEILNPTHILINSSASCIDLIFTSQPNLVMESGVHSSLHLNCHHQIVFAKFNLPSILYPPPSERTVWFYERADSEIIQTAINGFDSIRTLSNINRNVGGGGGNFLHSSPILLLFL